MKAIEVAPRDISARRSLPVLDDMEASDPDSMNVIARSRRAGAPGARAMARHAGLIWTLVRTDFKARYHGTLGGFVWALLKPSACSSC